MGNICPVCRKNKMRLGGMAAKEGSFCSKCWDRLNDAGVKNIPELTLREVDQLVNATPEDQIQKAYLGMMDNRKYAEALASRMKGFSESFRGACRAFFLGKGIPENAALQENVTQFLWHMLVLKKQRLDQKETVLDQDIRHEEVNGQPEVRSEYEFDGRYEIGLTQETVCGKVSYIRKGKTLFERTGFNRARYRTVSAKQEGEDRIVCPCCGNVSDRNNLMDGCDYCGSRFLVEDLGLRVNEYDLILDKEVEAEQRFNKSFFKNCLTAGIVVFAAGAVFLLLSGELFAGLFRLILWSAVLGFLFSFVKYVLSGVKGGFGNNDKYLEEERRRDRETVKKIRSFDPEFSLEGFYAEVQNMVSALHFARKPDQVSAFFENPEQDRIRKILSGYGDVLDISPRQIFLREYTVSGGMQHLGVEMLVKLLELKGENAREREERILLELVRKSSCMTRTVCAPVFLKCKSCGASLSLMEGAHCSYCGNDGKLSETGWAIQSYSVN